MPFLLTTEKGCRDNNLIVIGSFSGRGEFRGKHGAPWRHSKSCRLKISAAFVTGRQPEKFTFLVTLGNF